MARHLLLRQLIRASFFLVKGNGPGLGLELGFRVRVGFRFSVGSRFEVENLVGVGNVLVV